MEKHLERHKQFEEKFFRQPVQRLCYSIHTSKSTRAKQQATQAGQAQILQDYIQTNVVFSYFTVIKIPQKD